MMSTMLRRLTLLLAAAATVVAAGCGGSAEPPLQELRSLSGSVDASAQAGTGRFELSLEQTLPGSSKTLDITASGSFDTPARRMELRLDMSAFAELFGALGKAFGGEGNEETEALLDPDNWQLEAVLDGTVMFLRFPVLDAKLPSGKRWVQLDLRQLAATKGFDLGQLESYLRTDPRQTLSYLKAVAGKVVPTGREEVRGTETTRYTAVIDLVKVARQLPVSQRSLLGDLEQLARQVGLSLVPVAVWVDDYGLVRRMEMTITLEPTPGQEARTSLTYDLFDYGEPVEIETPPAAEVVDAATLERLG